MCAVGKSFWLKLRSMLAVYFAGLPVTLKTNAPSYGITASEA